MHVGDELQKPADQILQWDESTSNNLWGREFRMNFIDFGNLSTDLVKCDFFQVAHFVEPHVGNGAAREHDLVKRRVSPC